MGPWPAVAAALDSSQMSRLLHSVRELIESGPLAHLVTLNPDGSPHPSPPPLRAGCERWVPPYDSTTSIVFARSAVGWISMTSEPAKDGGVIS
jgi:hypothetical protein